MYRKEMFSSHLTSTEIVLTNRLIKTLNDRLNTKLVSIMRFQCDGDNGYTYAEGFKSQTPHLHVAVQSREQHVMCR